MLLQKRLPIDITSFETMVHDNFKYVDKTDLIALLAIEGSPCFLARPRRFGKSTLVNTFQELFSHGLESFKGLKIEQDGLYTDENTYNVLRLNFATCNESDNLSDYLIKVLTREFKRNAIDFDAQEDDPRFLLEGVLSKDENKGLVLLVDEYDTPLTQVLNNKEEFAKRRAILNSFYAVVKDQSNRFRFIFITGITRYSSMSIFSGFNNLKDLSLKPKYGALLGYTQQELEFYFKDYIEAAACELNRYFGTEQYSYESVLQLIRQNYYGYCFDSNAECSVYNPWSILNFLDDPTSGFVSYWVRSGSYPPAFLVKYLTNKRTDDLDDSFEYEQFLNIDASIPSNIKELSQSMVDMNSKSFSLKAVLYQAGYLCVKSSVSPDMLMLGIPNLEVKKAYAETILEFLGQQISSNFALHVQAYFKANFLQGSYDKIQEKMNQLVNTLSFESVSKFNESIFRDLFKITMLFAGASNIQSESPNSLGRSDLIFSFGDTCFVCEFKLAKRLTEVNSKLQEAEKQIRDNDYPNLLGITKVVPLAIVAVNQAKSPRKAAVRRFEVIKEV